MSIYTFSHNNKKLVLDLEVSSYFSARRSEKVPSNFQLPALISTQELEMKVLFEKLKTCELSVHCQLKSLVYVFVIIELIHLLITITYGVTGIIIQLTRCSF